MKNNIKIPKEIILCHISESEVNVCVHMHSRIERQLISAKMRSVTSNGVAKRVPG